ncbi:hypothetical protein SLEP1_g14002 [Rubroshorea leprosula]|uniref:Uncharacterized protein n=1 Tax=Rubroshorea leprosula TaxID=152421 RepID=A0AAV5INP6_9ROSI|nr:hypothetical protein SLEP1_g14002 [Rubroshorea leprosula]
MVYLDGDIQVFENIDHLFDIPDGKFYAVTDCFYEKTWSDTPQYRIGYCQQCPDKVQWPAKLGPKPPLYFNAGMFVFEPSLSVYDELLRKLEISPLTPFAEQDFLNMFFREIYEPIPPIYNLVLAMLWWHPENIEMEKVKVVHYSAAGSKPWRFTGIEQNMDREDIKMLVNKWWDIYIDESLDYNNYVASGEDEVVSRQPFLAVLSEAGIVIKPQRTVIEESESSARNDHLEKRMTQLPKRVHLTLTQNNLEELKDISHGWSTERRREFDRKFGHIGLLLFTTIDEAMLKAAIHFWDPRYRAFVFGEVDMTPTLWVKVRFPAAKDSGSGLKRQIPGYGRQFIAQVTTYFFYDFPADRSVKDMWFCFWSFGKVADVYIPARRDRRGRRYGFVRMSEVSDAKDMEQKLNQIWLGSYRLKVKLAGTMKRERVESARNSNRQVEKKWIRRESKVTPGRTYAQVVAGSMVAPEEGMSSNKDVRQDELTKGKEPVEDVVLEQIPERSTAPVISAGRVEERYSPKTDLVLEFTPKDEEVAWLKRSMVAIVRSLDIVKKIQNRLDVDGLMVNVALLGGHHVILVDYSEGGLEEFISHNSELVESWFDWIQPMSLSTMSSASRLVWLRCTGVPLKAWSERCFTELGGLIGEVILVDEDTRSKSFLCEGRVLILSEEKSKISTSISLIVDGKAFPITVQEEEWRMDPDWWLAGERRNPVVESDSENSEDGFSESTFNENGFLGDDGAVLAEDGAATERDSNFLLQKEVSLIEEDSGVNKEFNGLETFGPSGGIFNGPHICGEVEHQVDDRSVEDGSENGLEGPYVQVTRPDRTQKKRRSLGTIYAGVIGTKEARKVGTNWVTARTKARRNRRDPGVRGEELQTGSCSLSDGCIRHRNEVIRKQLQMGEVRELFVMGQNLGIQCQQNEEEVISRGLGSVIKRKEIFKLVSKEKPDFLFIQETKLEGVEVALCRKLWYSEDFDWVMQKSVGNSGGEWGKQRLKCNLVNVYAPCDKQRKAMLWEEMGSLVLEEGGRWLLTGDFNAIRNVAERKGRLGETQDMGDFNQFVEECGLIDVRLRNRKFTWYRPDGSSMSRLDRVLLSTEMSLLDREWVQVGVRRSISDHCALILTSRNTDWGPKPFRVLDTWQQHSDFKGFVEDKWKTLQIEGWAAFKCKQKLKLLKDECKGWNRGVFGNVEIQLETLLKHIERLDKKSEAEELSENEELMRKKCFQEMWDILRRKEAVWKQKSRNNWVRLGDANTAFFHRSVQTRRAQNAISGILGDEGWIEEPELVKAEAVKYFSELFHKDQWSRPVMGGIQFRKISAAQKEWLERPFPIEEIEEGLRSFDGSKAPGPDGYNFNFIKFAWNTLKDDFVNFLREFHQYGRLVKGLNSSFLTLIPKKLNPVQFKEYRPICLISCLYKLLAKVLANRLKKVMADIISESQSAFVGGRQLVDSVLVLNEVVDEVRRKKQESFIFKADFEKAYDCVDWDFLDWMMDRMGFGVKWRKWIRECLSTARISILVNGSPTSEFSVSKGLRQGDPLSPFLFLLVGEGLCGLVKKAESEGLLKGLGIGRGGMELSLLQFADDTVFMGKACAGNLKVVKAILHWFELISGLKINFSKSHLYGFNTSEGWLKGAAEIFIVGGGLGVADLERRNFALLGKWWFRLGDGVDGLWKRVIWEKYYEGRREVDITSFESLTMSRVWKDIVSVGRGSERLVEMLVKGFRWKVGEGRCVDFWRDKWVGDKCLKDLFPRLFALTTIREGRLTDMGFWRGDTWVWDCRWRRGCVGRAVGEEGQFREMINGVRLRMKEADSWQWLHGRDGIYSVKAAYDFLSPKVCVLDEKWSRIIWSKYVPSKLSVFGWRLFLDRLATKENLCKRGILLTGGDVSCGFCHEGVEGLHHIFCECEGVWLVWKKVLGWWGLQSVLPNDIFGLAESVVYGISGGCLKELGDLIFLVTAWLVWYWRNMKVFGPVLQAEVRLLESIQAKSFLWIKNKEPGCVFSYTDWISRPIDCKEAIVQHRHNLKKYKKMQCVVI